MRQDNRSLDWLRQAINDFEWAEETLKLNRYAQACFVAQQCGEKAIKALAMHRGVDEIRGHSIAEISKLLKVNGDIERCGKRLDQYYISSRYPDAFSSGSPYDYFTHDQAEEAIKFANTIIMFVTDAIK